MIMNTLNRAGGAVAMASPAVRTSRGDAVADSGVRGLSRDTSRFIARMLDAAEDTVPGASYAAARRRILRDLELNGSRRFAELPRAWPVSAQHLPPLVRELEQDGLVERIPQEAGGVRYRLTGDGAAALDATRATQLGLIARLLRAAADRDDDSADAAFSRLLAALGNGPDGHDQPGANQP